MMSDLPACPQCGCERIEVVEVTLCANGVRYEIAAALKPDGFDFSEQIEGDLDNYSTEDEVALCTRCGLRGPLSWFGFQCESDWKPEPELEIKYCEGYGCVTYDGWTLACIDFDALVHGCPAKVSVCGPGGAILAEAEIMLPAMV